MIDEYYSGSNSILLFSNNQSQIMACERKRNITSMSSEKLFYLGKGKKHKILSSLDYKTMVANFFSNQIPMWSALLWPGR